jgi:uncharacterized protein YjbJ (UPF0337 family)
MNTDQVKGALKEAGQGAAKSRRADRQPRQQAKGLAKQVEGAAQKKVGDVKEAVDDARKASK